ncbi:MAG TPA: alpha/beta hydrolase [Candidatus Dormibacteraeota bacterium]|nr:alpha/beta hydrolase [Candidatus Dormibacteraeota bacterium]
MTHTTDLTKPDTIVLIHGLWLTPLSWEHWIDRYSSRGYKVIAPSWPGMEGGIDDLRRNPDKVANLGVTEIVDHYDQVVRQLEHPPIIMGHSFGGLFTQILLDRSLGAAGVAIDSAPVKGVYILPFSELKVAWPALRNPANLNKAAIPTPEQFHYSFGNLLSEEESRAVYDRYAVPGPDHVLFQASFANFNPNAATAVNFLNDTRAPLLLIAGGKDHIVPASVTRANYNLYRKSKAVTDFKEYPDRSHYTVGQPGWEDVADYALKWAEENAAAHAKLAQPVAATAGAGN